MILVVYQIQLKVQINVCKNRKVQKREQHQSCTCITTFCPNLSSFHLVLFAVMFMGLNIIFDGHGIRVLHKVTSQW